MFSVQLLARFFSNSDKLIVPAQQTLLQVNLATKMFQYRDCDDGVFQRVMGFFHLFVDIVGLAVVELCGLVGMVVHLVGLVVDLVGLVRGWVDVVGLVDVEVVGLVDLIVDLVRLVVDLVNLGVIIFHLVRFY